MNVKKQTKFKQKDKCLLKVKYTQRIRFMCIIKQVSNNTINVY